MDKESKSPCKLESFQLIPLAEDYIRCCTDSQRLPNIAGLCRYLGVSARTLNSLSEQYPEEFAQIRDALEDEALNSDRPASLLGSYLKTRLGYGETENQDSDGDITVVFEHDAMKDGQ